MDSNFPSFFRKILCSLLRGPGMILIQVNTMGSLIIYDHLNHWAFQHTYMRHFPSTSGESKNLTEVNESMHQA